MYPGEEVVRTFKDKDTGDWHIQTNFREGVSGEKAAKLHEQAKQLDPKRFLFNKYLTAGRDTQSFNGYADDMSSLDQRINAKGLGEESAKSAKTAALDELRRRKKLK